VQGLGIRMPDLDARGFVEQNTRPTERGRGTPRTSGHGHTHKHTNNRQGNNNNYKGTRGTKTKHAKSVF